MQGLIVDKIRAIFPIDRDMSRDKERLEEFEAFYEPLIKDKEKWHYDQVCIEAHLDGKDCPHEKNCPFDPKLIELSIRCNSIILLQYLHESGCILESNAWYDAVDYDFGECLKYLFEHVDEPLNKDYILESCCLRGKVKCVKYLRESGVGNDDDYDCSTAAYQGYLDLLKYYHTSGCSWNHKTTKNASKNKHLECFKYAHEHGCSWNEKVFINALKTKKHENLENQLKILKYAYLNRCPGYEKYYRFLTKNLLFENMAVLYAGIRLKIWIIRFRQRYYSLSGKGFQLASNRFHNY